jgi:hypothetical protein
MTQKISTPAAANDDEATVTDAVREKLAALDSILMDHCISCTQTYIALQAKKSKAIKRSLQAPIGLYGGSEGSSHGAAEVLIENPEEDKKMTMEHTKAVAEIKEFLEEQVCLLASPV